MLPFCESTYRVEESLGAGMAYSPSPPVTVNHSDPVMRPAGPADGPHQALLSCKPPHSKYGLLLSAATM